jgi:lactate dehydrogenase-like 2-hydroxyacid dehydrogenase
MINKPHLLIVTNFDSAAIKKLDDTYSTHKLWLAQDKAERQALLESIAPHCTAMATFHFANAKMINVLPELKMIASFGVGTDGIDFEAVKTRDILVSNTPEVLNNEVADLALALILAAQRQIIAADKFVRDGQWLNGPMPLGRGLSGKTLGIMGLGRIGEAIAERALACKMNIAYHNRKRKDVPYQYCDSLLALASASDVLLNVLPSTAETAQIVNKEILQALGREGTFINIGRGDTVDQTALIEALQNKVIASAGLDVYVNEPNVPSELIALPNVVLMPHIGSATVETRVAMGQLVIDNLEAFFSGRPLLTPVTE